MNDSILFLVAAIVLVALTTLNPDGVRLRNRVFGLVRWVINEALATVLEVVGLWCFPPRKSFWIGFGFGCWFFAFENWCSYRPEDYGWETRETFGFPFQISTENGIAWGYDDICFVLSNIVIAVLVSALTGFLLRKLACWSNSTKVTGRVISLLFLAAGCLSSPN